MDADTLWDNGSYLMSVDFHGFKIDLYSIGQEYYEVYYDSDFNNITKIRLAANDDLQKYLNEIDLENLLKEKGQ